jgi:ATP-dependent DNA helicase RecG
VHESIPRNKLIANAFFMVKYIEQWGTGTNRMIQWCLNEKLPEPEFEDKKRAFVVRIRKDIYSEGNLRNKGLSERQIRAVIYAKEKGKITNKD